LLTQTAAGLPDFFGATHQNRKNLPNENIIYQMAITDGRKIFKMAINYLFKHFPFHHFMALQQLPELGVFGQKIYNLATLDSRP
jgi:hypothetical protein